MTNMRSEFEFDGRQAKGNIQVKIDMDICLQSLAETTRAQTETFRKNLTKKSCYLESFGFLSVL